MNAKNAITSFGKIIGIIVVIVMLFGLGLLIAMVINPSLFPKLFAQVITVQISVIAIGVFVVVNFLIVTYFLYASYTHTKIILQNIEKEKQINTAKNDLISLVSHQLRTPLSAVNWYTEALLHGDMGAINEKQNQYITAVRESNQRMIAMVDSILDASRIDLKTFAVSPEPLGLFDLLEKVTDDFKNQFDYKKINFIKKYASDLGTIVADPKYARLIIENLLSNAIKYTQQGGTISVSAYNLHKQFHITVADTGYGIPIKDFPKVFTKLFRAENILNKDTDGTGLGLYIVHSIISFIGGTIRFESTEGKGTTFFVTLPNKPQV
jgi:two-component system sensor histidine kinase VicK